MRGVPTRVVLAGMLLVALVLAGVVSFYASGHPDAHIGNHNEHGQA